MAKKAFNIHRVNSLPSSGVNGDWYLVRKSNGRFDLYVVAMGTVFVPVQGMTDVELNSVTRLIPNINKLEGLNTQEEIDNKINTIESGYKGIATPSTVWNSSTPIGRYLAKESGTYNGIVVDVTGKEVYLDWDGTVLNKVEIPISVSGTDVITTNGTDIVTEKAVRDYSATKLEVENKADSSLEVGKNKFNKDTVTSGKYRNAAGTIVDSASNVMSAFIPVELNVEYRFRSAANNSGFRFLTALDINGNPIVAEGSDVGLSSKIFTDPNVRYAVVSVNVAALDDFQMEIGSVSTPYEPYSGKKVLAESQIPSNVRTEEVKIDQEDLSFAELKTGSNNIVDITASDVEENTYLNATGSTVVDADGIYNTTGFIPVSRSINLNVTISRQRFSAFYDSNKQLIAGSYDNTSGNNITRAIPVGAVYLRVSVPKVSNGIPYWNPLMINYGTTILPWEAYKESYYQLNNVRLAGEEDPTLIGDLLNSITGQESSIVEQTNL